MTSWKIVIPARLKSTRLPEKPLAEINGKPMILHTLDRAYEAAEAKDVFVATDSHQIAKVVEASGGQAVMTTDKCLTGTDRVAEFAQQVPADVYINLQGDEPMMDTKNITSIIEHCQKRPEQILNGWAWVQDENEYRSTTIPKVVIREDGRLMYMSRSPIPGTKDGLFCASRKQVCVYAFPRAALEAFAARDKKSEHEAFEDIEILRFLEMGWDVQMLEMTGNFRAVDTPEDLEIVRAEMSEKTWLSAV